MSLVQELLSFNDLVSLNSSPNSVRQKFTDHFGKTPDGICVNDEVYYDSVTPAITQQYGHPCYKVLGDFTYTVSEDSPSEAIIGTNSTFNNSDSEVTISLSVDGYWSDSTTWDTSTTIGITKSAHATVLIFSGGYDLNVSMTLGKSESVSKSMSCSSSVILNVPPRHKQTARMIGTLKKAKVRFTAPINVQGMFGANFPDRVQGHYFWFLDSSLVLGKTSGIAEGEITCSMVFDTKVEVDKPEPLTAEELRLLNDENNKMPQLKRSLWLNDNYNNLRYDVCACRCGCSCECNDPKHPEARTTNYSTESNVSAIPRRNTQR